MRSTSEWIVLLDRSNPGAAPRRSGQFALVPLGPDRDIPPGPSIVLGYPGVLVLNRGTAMRRRSRAGGPGKPQRRKTAARKTRIVPKARPRSPPIASLEAKVAWLAAELDEALERQSATANILGAISRSIELQSILQTVVDTASQLCRADASVIFRLEGGVYRFAAGYSLIPSYMEHERRNPISPGTGTLIGRAALNRRVVQIEDAWTDPLYEQKAVDDWRAADAQRRTDRRHWALMQPCGTFCAARNRLSHDLRQPSCNRHRKCATT